MKEPGKGSNRRCTDGYPELYVGLRRISIAFDEATFARVRDRAVEHQTSFAEQARTLIERGLLPADQQREAAE